MLMTNLSPLGLPNIWLVLKLTLPAP